MDSAAQRQASGVRSDNELESGMCVGTFRWKRSKVLPELPPFKAGAALPPVSRGWAPYLEVRCRGAKPSPVEFAQHDLSLIDGLSFPLSLMSPTSLVFSAT